MGSGLETHQLVKVRFCVLNSALHIIIIKIAPTIVLCPNLPNPQNGQVSQQGNKPGNRASYTCNSGYELIGQSTRTCQSNGEWSGVAPTCESMHT